MEHVRITMLVQLWFIGLFFNNFFPSGLGGDFAKAYYLLRRSDRNPVSVSSLVVLRAVGIFGLVTLVLFGVLSSGNRIPVNIKNNILLLLFFLCVLIVLLLFGYRMLFGKVADIFASLRKTKVWQWIQQVRGSLASYSGQKSILLFSILLAICSHILLILVNSAFCYALDCQTSVMTLLLCIPVINFLQMLPISMNGLGVREGAYVFFFANFGMPESVAFSLSLLMLLNIVIFGVVGGLLFALRRT
jgi:uncharacterized protein (TIRG00374 family)